MAMAKRERDRTLALNVAQIFTTQGKCDWQAFIETGALTVWRSHPVPHSPTFLAAREKLIADYAEVKHRKRQENGFGH